MSFDSLEKVIEALNQIAWLDEFSGLKSQAGADITGVTIDRYGLTITAHEKHGSGAEPYAIDPSEHVAQLNHPSFAHGEGMVIYDSAGEYEGPLKLPKHLYFEERHEFDEPITSTADIETHLMEILGVEINVHDDVSEDQSITSTPL